MQKIVLVPIERAVHSSCGPPGRLAECRLDDQSAEKNSHEESQKDSRYWRRFDEQFQNTPPRCGVPPSLQQVEDVSPGHQQFILMRMSGDPGPNRRRKEKARAEN